MNKYQNSKTYVYIDAANIILTARDVNLNLNLHRLFVFLKDKYRTERIIFFIGDVKYLNEIKIILEEHKIEIVLKQTIKEGGKIKANCDVEMANRITIDVERGLTDTVVLLSGDGDFAVSMDYCLEMKKEAKCIAVSRKLTSFFLRKRQYLETVYLDEVSEFIEVDRENL